MQRLHRPHSLEEVEAAERHRFGWIAVRRSRPSGLVPILTAFVGLLTLLSANDLWLGQVDGTRLLSHALIVAGYLIVIALTRPRFDLGDPPTQRQRGRWSLHIDDDVPADKPRLRLVPPQLSRQSARHDSAA